MTSKFDMVVTNNYKVGREYASANKIHTVVDTTKRVKNLLRGLNLAQWRIHLVSDDLGPDSWEQLLEPLHEAAVFAGGVLDDFVVANVSANTPGKAKGKAAVPPWFRNAKAWLLFRKTTPGGSCQGEVDGYHGSLEAAFAAASVHDGYGCWKEIVHGVFEIGREELDGWKPGDWFVHRVEVSRSRCGGRSR